MENSITLDLKTYTDLIRENEQLREIIFKRELDGYSENHDYTLGCMKDKAKLNDIFKEKDDMKVVEKAGLSTCAIQRAAEKYRWAYSIEDVCAYLADILRTMAKDKLAEMKAKGDDEQ